MKNISRFLFSLFVLMLIMNQQIFSQSVHEVGVKIGVTASTFSGKGTSAIDAKTLFGISGGAFYEYSFSHNISIQPELLYSQRGTNSTYYYLDSIADKHSTSTNHKLSYIDIPILLKYHFQINEQLKANIFIGPSTGVLLKARYHLFKSSFSEKRQFKDMDFNATLGVGISYPIFSGRIMSDIRYNFGLQNISKYSNTVGERFHNRSLLILMGYSF